MVAINIPMYSNPISVSNPLLSLVSLLPKEWLLKISLVLLLLTTGLIISLLILRSKNKDKIKIEKFTFVDPPGYYTHPKYHFKICPNCLIKEGRISPVSKVDEFSWYCNVCDKPMSGSRGEAFTVND